MSLFKAFAMMSGIFAAAAAFSGWVILCGWFFQGSGLGLCVALSPIFFGGVLLLWLL